MREIMHSFFSTSLFIFLFLFGSHLIPAQTGPADIAIDPAARTLVIETVVEQLGEQYIFPETAKEIEKAIRVRRKEFDNITSSIELAKKLTSILREVSRDQHFSVNFSFKPLPPNKADKAGDKKGEPTAEEREGLRNYGEAINFGFEKVERLPANIGYLRLNLFFPVEYGADTAVAAMNFLAYTETLIIDLRGNDGGSPHMELLLASYLFGSEPVRLSDLQRRKETAVQQFWTQPSVPGKKFIGKDVFILTSKRTFSAAEAFAYDLQSLKRATIVGETTGGGANPRDVVRINEHFWIGLPTARAVNPVTKTNWEGTGVKPDVEVPAEQALKTAQLLALKKLLDSAVKAGNEIGVNNLNKLIGTLEKELEELKAKSK